jgi:hypothetical protein
MPSHRFRQIHLDFHTSAQCQDVGVDFDPQTFVKTLQSGHVNQINIFGRCHHGYSYYPTQVGRMHPNLKFDLLGRMIETLHGADIVCPIYMTVKWDDLAGSLHPEWVCVNKQGQMVMRPPLLGQWGWTTLDVTTPYADYLAAQIDELFERYGSEVDGIWFDICFPVPNYSPAGMQKMVTGGVNPEDDAAVYRFWRDQDIKFFERMTRLVHTRNEKAFIFYNGTVTTEMGELLPYHTHFEVESLPTSGGAWGYMHFPIVGRQARTYGREVIGMTGRFHRSWSDFGGLKTSDQLDYECGTIMAAGARICVGDQLHPRGALDPAVYRMIGRSYARVEALEPWLEDAKPAAEVAVLALGKPSEDKIGIGAHSPDAEGAGQVLLEGGIQFDVVDQQADLGQYPALILPDSAVLDDAWRSKLNEYLQFGGKLVLSGSAALDPQTGRFVLPQVPVEYLGQVPTVPCYLYPDETLAGVSELATDYGYVFYQQAHLVKPFGEARPLGDIRRALFNRSWEHFTGHQHAPYGDSLGAPVAVLGENVLYFAAPLFSGFRDDDYWAYRQMALNALRGILPAALLIPSAPGWVEFTLHTQPSNTDHPMRRIVHIVAYHPRRSFQSVAHVDQGALTAGLSFSLRLDSFQPQRVYLAPDGQSLEYSIQDGYLQVNLPPVGIHSVVVVE